MYIKMQKYIFFNSKHIEMKKSFYTLTDSIFLATDIQKI